MNSIRFESYSNRIVFLYNLDAYYCLSFLTFGPRFYLDRLNKNFSKTGSNAFLLGCTVVTEGWQRLRINYITIKLLILERDCLQ